MVAGQEELDNQTSPGVCPPYNIARSLAVAHAALMWARVRCVDPFRSEVFDLNTAPSADGGCVLRLHSLGGQVKVLLDTNFVAGHSEEDCAGEGPKCAWPVLGNMVRGAAIRVSLSLSEPWSKFDGRACLLGPRVGYMPLPRPVQRETQIFAVSALNANRAVEKCGASLLFKEGAEPFAYAGVVGRATVLRFFLPVELPSAKLRYALVHVTLEVLSFWDADRQASAGERLMFLGSDPPPCEIGLDGVGEGQEMWAVRSPTDGEEVPAVLAGTASEIARDDLEEQVHMQSRTELLTANVMRAKGLDRLPQGWDLRTVAQTCVPAARQQGRCVGAWALAAVGSFEKQACYLSHGALQVQLSAQYVSDCGSGMAGCFGGRIEDALRLLFDNGALPEACGPWAAAPGLDAKTATDVFTEVNSMFPPANFSSKSVAHSTMLPEEAVRCQSEMRSVSRECTRVRARLPLEIERRVNVWPMAPVGVMAVRGPRMIQAAILTYGAVTSTVEVYPDFLGYGGGVYRRAPTLGPHDLRGTTAVQLLGWGRLPAPGIEKGQQYWIGQNSFGTAWGEGGFFRWVRGEDHLGIERRVMLGLVAGLTPLASDVSGRGLGGDQVSELQRKDVYYEQTLALLHGQNFWLAASGVVMPIVAAVSVICGIRYCLCSGGDDGEEHQRPPLRVPKAR